MLLYAMDAFATLMRYAAMPLLRAMPAPLDAVTLSMPIFCLRFSLPGFLRVILPRMRLRY